MKKISHLKGAWIFLPVIPYFVILFRNAPNIPIMDDYDVILSFLTQWKNAGFSQRFSLLLLQTNEHRILHSRLIFAGYYSLFGNVNFRSLIILADLQLIVIAAVAVYFVRQSGGKYWRFMAFLWMLCIFDLNTYEAGSSAMIGMQCYGVIMLFFASLFFYDRNRRWLPLAALLELLCIFSSGAGVIAAFFITLFLLRSADKWKKWVGVATAGMGIPLYFVHYSFGSHPDALPFSANNVMVFFIRMTGAPFNFDYSLLFGILILGLLIFLFVKGPLNAPWPLLCILGYLLTAMATSAWFRANLKGAQFQTSRYLIYPQLVLAILCLLGWLKLETKKYHHATLAGIGLVLINVYAHNFEFGKLGFMRTAARAKAFLYWYPNRAKARQIVDGACQAEIYCLEEEKEHILLSAE
jgi:hypothetical protein